MIYITGIHLAHGGSGHEHITHLRWLNPENGVARNNTTAQLVAFLEQYPGQALVAGDPGPAEVHVVNANPPYLRTVADNTYTDNLLYLPQF